MKMVIISMLKKILNGRLQTNLKLKLNPKKETLILIQTQTETRYFIMCGTSHME